MTQTPDDFVEDGLRQAFEQTLKEKVARSQQIKVHQFIPCGFFALASSECRDMFVEEHFYGCICTAQAVAEGLAKFVAVKNGMTPPSDFGRCIRILQSNGLISDEVAGAFQRVHGTDRNDFHHLNKGVEQDRRKLEVRAAQCLAALHEIESNIFGYAVDDGRIVPNHPKYWPSPSPDGTALVYVRR